MTDEKFSFKFVTKIKEDYFPGELKLTEVSPIFKEKNDLEKESYRAVSVLPHVPKFFERIMYHQ